MSEKLVDLLVRYFEESDKKDEAVESIEKRVIKLEEDMSTFQGLKSETIVGQTGQNIVPEAPTGLTVEVISDTQSSLAWSNTDDGSNSSGVLIERRSGYDDFSVIAEVSNNVESYTDTLLAAGTSYIYRVRAKNATGNSGYTDEAVITTTTPPFNPPYELTAANIGSENELALTWKNEALGVTSYHLERKAGAGSFEEVFTTTDAVTAVGYSYTDQGLTDDTEYTYRLRSKNDGGYSEYTDEISATTTLAVSGETVPGTSSGSEFGYTNNPTITRDIFENCLIVEVYSRDVDAVTGATVDATPLVELVREHTANQAGVIIFGLLNPPQGADKVISVEASDYKLFNISAETFDKVSSFGVTNSDANYGASPSLSLTTSKDDSVIVHAVNVQEDREISTTDGIETYNKTNPDANLGQSSAAYKAVATTGANTLSWSFTGDSNWVMAAVELRSTGAEVAPSAPTALSISSVGTNFASLSWERNTESNFKIERKIGTGSFVEIDSIIVAGSASTATYTDSNLDPGVLYTYRIKSYNSVGESAYSNEEGDTTAEQGVETTYTPADNFLAMVSAELGRFRAWAGSPDVRLYLGEWGIPRDRGDIEKWIGVANCIALRCKADNIGWTYWSNSHLWNNEQGASYNLSTHEVKNGAAGGNWTPTAIAAALDTNLGDRDVPFTGNAYAGQEFVSVNTLASKAPLASDFKFFREKGATVQRYAIGENNQNVNIWNVNTDSFGTFEGESLILHVERVLNEAQKDGTKIILDYLHPGTGGGNYAKIGGNTLATTQGYNDYIKYMTALCNHGFNDANGNYVQLKNHPALFMLDICNEPSQVDSNEWETISQNIVNVLRGSTIGYTGDITVPLGNYSGVQDLNFRHGGGPWINDPLGGNHIVYQGHYYPEKSHIGNFAGRTYQQEVNDASGFAGQGSFTYTGGSGGGGGLPTCGVITSENALEARAMRVAKEWVDWLNGKKGLIGEFGVPWAFANTPFEGKDNDIPPADRAKWIRMTNKVFAIWNNWKIEATLWATGEFWGSYAYSIHDDSGSFVTPRWNEEPFIETNNPYGNEANVTTLDYLRGSNTAGAEFGFAPDGPSSVHSANNFTNEWEDNYTSDKNRYPSQALLQFHYDRGLTFIRVPVRLEKFYTSQTDTTFEPLEMNRLKDVLTFAQNVSPSVRVLVDIHNYGAFITGATPPFATQRLGQGWTQANCNAQILNIVNEIKGYTCFHGIDIMNEPSQVFPNTGQSALQQGQTWEGMSTSIVNHLRNNSYTGLIYVPTAQWSGAYSAPEHHPNGPWIDDDNIVWESHQYFDKNNDGITNDDETFDAMAAHYDDEPQFTYEITRENCQIDGVQGGNGSGDTGTGGAVVAGTDGNTPDILHIDFTKKSQKAYGQISGQEMAAYSPHGADYTPNGTQDCAIVADPQEGNVLECRLIPSSGGSNHILAPWFIGGSHKEVWTSYKFKFMPGFEYSRGGKLPGPGGGDTPTGGATPGQGMTARMMWKANTDGSDKQIKLYMYHLNQPNYWGEYFDTGVYVEPDKWTTITHHLNVGTPGNNDGSLVIYINGVKKIDLQNHQFIASGSDWDVTEMTLSTFYGGGDSSWSPSKTTYLRFAQFKVGTDGNKIDF